MEKLPERWCIKVTTENSEMVGKHFSIVSSCYNEWIKKNQNQNSDTSRAYLCSHNDEEQLVKKESRSSFSSSNPKGTELTDEQFEKLVLNKEEVEINITLEDLSYLKTLLEKLNL